MKTDNPNSSPITEDRKPAAVLFDPWEARFSKDFLPAKIGAPKHPHAGDKSKAA